MRLACSTRHSGMFARTLSYVSLNDAGNLKSVCLTYFGGLMLISSALSCQSTHRHLVAAEVVAHNCDILVQLRFLESAIVVPLLFWVNTYHQVYISGSLQLCTALLVHFCLSIAYCRFARTLGEDKIAMFESSTSVPWLMLVCCLTILTSSSTHPRLLAIQFLGIPGNGGTLGGLRSPSM